MSTTAWQGWRLELPSRWNPVKLEGDADEGLALFADLHRPRLGMRWTKPKRRWRKKVDIEKSIRLMMRNEVGQLAADEAVAHAPAGDAQWISPWLYLEPDPPGRDVWIGYSPVSNRILQVVHHAHRRERVLSDVVLPSLADQPRDAPMRWSVFELSCVVPAGFKLAGQTLNAGDLHLRFAHQRRRLEVRQVAVAELALQRLKLKQWLSRQQNPSRRYYRIPRLSDDLTIDVGGRELTGVTRTMRRRRRYFFMRKLPRRLVTVALHDVPRDRLVFVQASDQTLLRQTLATIGRAAESESDSALTSNGY